MLKTTSRGQLCSPCSKRMTSYPRQPIRGTTTTLSIIASCHCWPNQIALAVATVVAEKDRFFPVRGTVKMVDRVRLITTVQTLGHHLSRHCRVTTAPGPRVLLTAQVSRPTALNAPCDGLTMRARDNMGFDIRRMDQLSDHVSRAPLCLADTASLRTAQTGTFGPGLVDSEFHSFCGARMDHGPWVIHLVFT